MQKYLKKSYAWGFGYRLRTFELSLPPKLERCNELYEIRVGKLSGSCSCVRTQEQIVDKRYTRVTKRFVI